MPHARRQTPRPVTSSQERLWFLDQLNPGSLVYNLPFRFHLRGELDVDAFRAAVNALVSRHEALRTRFLAIDGRPVQIVVPELLLTVQVADLVSDAANDSDVIHRFAREEGARPFDLAEGPLIRVVLVKTDAQEHILLLTMHHIVADAWSTGILLRDLSVFYDAFTKDESPMLAPIAMQYTEYATHQREWLESEAAATQLQYWHGQLQGAPRVLEIPADRPRPPMQSFAGSAYRFQLPRAVSDHARALGRDEGATLFMTLLAAFKALICRYTTSNDIVLGTMVANRGDLQTEELVGFFANTLVLRTSARDDPTFRELLRRVKEVSLDALANQDLPFERLVEDLQPERDLSRAPLVQIVFVLQPSFDEALQLQGMKVTALEPLLQAVEFDLGLTVEETAEGIALLFEYSTDLFDPATIVRMAGHFATLLEDAVTDPAKRLSRLRLLTDEEVRQFDIWNLSEAHETEWVDIGDQFEEQVRKTPEAIAISFEDESLSYVELDHQATRLAEHLRASGAGPGTLVAICLPRSLELVVSLMGVVKSGAGYVPLDPTYPEQRLAFMLDDCEAIFLVTQESMLGRLPEIKPTLVIVEPALWNGEYAPVSKPGVHIRPEDLAYVMYTSGSTGKPKGVAITRANVLSFFAAMDLMIPSESGRVWLAATSFSFDISVLELFWTLARGFTVVLQRSELDEAEIKGRGSALANVEAVRTWS